MVRSSLLRRLTLWNRQQVQQVFPGLKTSDLQVTHGGSDRSMTHQRLDSAHVKTGFQQVRGKAMSQRVNAVTAGDARPAFGFVIDPLRLADMHLALGISTAGEEPGGGMAELPVETKFIE